MKLNRYFSDFHIDNSIGLVSSFKITIGSKLDGNFHIYNSILYKCVKRTHVLYTVFFDIVCVKFDFTHRFSCAKFLRILCVKMNFTHGKWCVKSNFTHTMSKNKLCQLKTLKIRAA